VYSYAGLDDDQIAYIEEGIASETIPHGQPRRRTAFGVVLNVILNKLASQGFSLHQFALLCERQVVPGAATVVQADLSTWRHGRAAITLEKLRSLVAGLRQLGPERLHDPVTSGEINQLIGAAGFASDELTDTTHDLVARIGSHSEIQPLLVALRRATDLSLPAGSEELLRYAASLGVTLPQAFAMNVYWEHNDRMSLPTGAQVRELLDCYNHFIRRNGFPPLADEDIAKVLAVAERDHARWKSLTHAEKLAKLPPGTRRQPPSPAFDRGESGRG
jgi:hypothetical protein